MDIESGSSNNNEKTNKFITNVIALRGFRRTRRFHDYDNVDGAQLKAKRKKNDKSQSCFFRCFERQKAILMKIWSVTANILLCAFDSGTDSWTATNHYKK